MLGAARVPTNDELTLRLGCEPSAGAQIVRVYVRTIQAEGPLRSWSAI